MATYGADPELFLRDTRTGMVASAVGLIGGTKGAAIPMKGLPDGYGLQEDNVMVEYNIPACTSSSRFVRAIQQGLGHINELVRTSLPHYEVDTGACARLFSSEQLDNPQAQVFGCSPDFNAHEQGQPCPSITPELLNEEDGGAWRFAGGHVHIGYENVSGAPDFVAAALADVYIGLRCASYDYQGRRRGLYGSAGRYRPTKWGIEYRTLSNFWIWDRDMQAMVAHGANQLGLVLESPDPERLQAWYAEVPWIDVQDAINNEDGAKANDLRSYLMSEFGMEV